MLFTAGEAADGAYIVLQGSFSLKPESAGEAEVVAGAGTLARRIGLAGGDQTPGDRHCARGLHRLRISRSMFMQMLEGYPDAAQRLRDLIAARTDQWTREMENVRAALMRRGGPR